mmetsp:Transcript_30522/g.84210  ORF Transcript_30522/g.84210 Transcript_30522/m.84210 type:complete len:353 (+) Transcript_30522:772-1830(+)
MLHVQVAQVHVESSSLLLVVGPHPLDLRAEVRADLGGGLCKVLFDGAEPRTLNPDHLLHPVVELLERLCRPCCQLVDTVVDVLVLCPDVFPDERELLLGILFQLPDLVGDRVVQLLTCNFERFSSGLQSSLKVFIQLPEPIIDPDDILMQFFVNPADGFRQASFRLVELCSQSILCINKLLPQVRKLLLVPLLHLLLGAAPQVHVDLDRLQALQLLAVLEQLCLGRQQVRRDLLLQLVVHLPLALLLRNNFLELLLCTPSQLLNHQVELLIALFAVVLDLEAVLPHDVEIPKCGFIGLNKGIDLNLQLLLVLFLSVVDLTDSNAKVSLGLFPAALQPPVQVVQSPLELVSDS